MYTVALTGGVASGKSAASAIFTKLGAGVIDADLVSRELVQPGQAALTRIVQAFGEEILNQQGEINRALLRQRVFTDPDKRRQLEAILHPLICDAMWQQARQSDAPYVMLVVPLLYGNQSHYPVNRILLIDVPENMQRIRIKQRDQIGDRMAEQILMSQSSRQQRLQIADDVIQNTGTLAALQHQVENHHQRYLKLADAFDMSE